ncbi:uncharacterized protein RAG0_03495 [Rhynchosporium agropyri]|uniref:Ada DNA repair metal-binding domain-containing protein n=1 Tax=Rhynchosporium agropyri TaxID=914238 RepID=A0A1E1K8S7_9HELO|nr:uncharacterized protein RAG0_03495 [Rhynchosporium agropyri]
MPNSSSRSSSEPSMTGFSSTKSRWAALQSRNPLAASAFICSVINTKIYCRPNCPSRLAQEVGLTESHFCRVFKKVMRMTLGEYGTEINVGMTDQVEQEPSNYSRSASNIVGSLTDGRKPSP